MNIFNVINYNKFNQQTKLGFVFTPDMLNNFIWKKETNFCIYLQTLVRTSPNSTPAVSGKQMDT